MVSKTMVLKYNSMGFGEVIAMEPTIRYLRERGHVVMVEACNPKLAPLVGLLGATFLPSGRSFQGKATYLQMEGKACLLESNVTNGNRAKAHILSVHPPNKLLNDGYTRPRLCTDSSLPSVSTEIIDLAKSRVFVQLYAGESYKVPTDKWYEDFLYCMDQDGILGFSIVESRAFIKFRIPENFILIEDGNILSSLAIFQYARVAVVFDSLWLQAAGLLNKYALAMSGPYTSAGRIEDFDNVMMLQNPCPHSPCWRNSEIPCKVLGDVSECLNPPLNISIPLLLKVLKGAQ